MKLQTGLTWKSVIFTVNSHKNKLKNRPWSHTIINENYVIKYNKIQIVW